MARSVGVARVNRVMLTWLLAQGIRPGPAARIEQQFRGYKLETLQAAFRAHMAETGSLTQTVAHLQQGHLSVDGERRTGFEQAGDYADQAADREMSSVWQELHPGWPFEQGS